MRATQLAVIPAPEHRRYRSERPPSADDVEEALLARWVERSRPAARALVGFFQRCSGLRFEAEFAGPLTAAAGPLIFASNHCSHVDTGAITATLPHEFRDRTLVAAAMDTFGTSPRRGVARLVQPLVRFAVGAAFRAFAFDRSEHSLQSVRASIRLVSRGWNLLLYPEGTRSRTGELGPFKAGVGLLARVTARPVVPVHIEGSHRALPCGTWWPRRGTIRVRYGTPLFCDMHEAPAVFAGRLRESVRALGGNACTSDC